MRTLLLLASACAAFPTAAPALSAVESPASSIAVLTEIEGNVTVQRAGDPEAVPAEEDMDLGEGDKIVTGAGGRATISLLDEHFVSLGERATMTLRKAKSEPSSGSFWARIALAAGKLMAAVSSLTVPGSRFEVETPTAVATVKGTTFAVEASAAASTVSVLEGTVEASGVEGKSAEVVAVKEGYETVVAKKTRRPGALRKFFKNEKRHKFLVGLSEFRARSLRMRSQGRSGELRQGRRMRTLVRAVFILDLKERNPAAYRSLPRWRRDQLDRYIAAAGPDLEARRAEITEFLRKNPRLKARLEQQVRVRFAPAKGRGKGPARGGAGKSGRTTKTRQARAAPASP